MKKQESRFEILQHEGWNRQFIAIEPEVVRQGDMGNLANLDRDKLSFVKEFDKMVEEIVKKTNM